MTDDQILQYLQERNYSIAAQDGVMDILNRSYQILDSNYDFRTRKMTIMTPGNTFIFDWVLNRIN